MPHHVAAASSPAYRLPALKTEGAAREVSSGPSEGSDRAPEQASSHAHEGARPSAAKPALTRHALVPLSLVAGFALVYLARVPPVWLVLLGAPWVLLYFTAPSIGRRSLARFDREAIALLSVGRAQAAASRYHRALGMRLFAPPAEVAERRGRVEAARGAHAGARDAYAAAAAGFPAYAVPVGVRLGLAHARYALGEDDGAIDAYRAIVRTSEDFPRVALQLAHALARRGRPEDVAEAERWAERARAEEPASGEAMLVRALVHARRGEREAADLLAEAGDDPARASLREDITRALVATPRRATATPREATPSDAPSSSRPPEVMPAEVSARHVKSNGGKARGAKKKARRRAR